MDWKYIKNYWRRIIKASWVDALEVVGMKKTFSLLPYLAMALILVGAIYLVEVASLQLLERQFDGIKQTGE